VRSAAERMWILFRVPSSNPAWSPVKEAVVGSFSWTFGESGPNLDAEAREVLHMEEGEEMPSGPLRWPPYLRGMDESGMCAERVEVRSAAERMWILFRVPSSNPGPNLDAEAREVLHMEEGEEMPSGPLRWERGEGGGGSDPTRQRSSRACRRTCAGWTRAACAPRGSR
jgi:hypothetical protein